MACKQKFKELFLKCDIFSTSEFLRYNDEPEYRTYTGAFFSVVTVVVFCGIFMSVMVSTFAKTEIIWSLNTMNVGADQFAVSTQLQGQNKFMFAVSLSGYDLNTNNQRMFDVKFLLRTKINTISQPDILIPLEKCTTEHWNVNVEFLQIYDRMGFSNMLCPPIGLSIPIQGKFTSQIFKYAEIRFIKCEATATKTCANDTVLQGKTFFYNLYVLNTLINPESAEYISYYLQDRNYVQFTTSFSSLVNIFISNYEITTDQSITPIKEEREEVGAILTNLGQVIPRQIDSNNYANIVLRRASTKLIASRSFKRVDDTLSYIGGLFGFALVLLLFMKEYTEYSYQIDASSHLYYEDHQKPIQSHKFNFFIFIGYLAYILLDAVGFKPNWKTMESLDDCREQIQKQLDVRFLFQRINFLEKSLSTLFNDNQSQLLHLLRRPTLKEASQLRQNYQMRKVLMQNAETNQQQMTENPLQITTDNIQTSWKRGTNKVIPTNSGIIEDRGQQALGSRQNDMLFKLKGNYKLLKKHTMEGNQISKKIIEDMDPNIIRIIYENQQQESIANDIDQSSSIQKFRKSQRKKEQEMKSEEVEPKDTGNNAVIQDVRQQENENSYPFQFVN